VLLRTERFQFEATGGHKLAAALDAPDDKADGYALFAHCFTCGKDVLAARRIAATLVARRIAVLRFDFTGLGASEGEFANSTFSSNVADLVRAADHLRRMGKSPALLIGHSLGGAALLAAAGEIPEAKAIVTIGAPSDPAHVTHLFKDRLEDIRGLGEVEVALAGRPFRIRREFLDDVAEQKLLEKIGRLHRALLIMHSPTDDTVGIENATEIFSAAKHPKSYVSLAGADHLLNDKEDAVYVAEVIAAWSRRYVEASPPRVSDLVDALGNVIVPNTGAGLG
jgi:pimeloyl-ACP methyl ester carboxylesterase